MGLNDFKCILDIVIDSVVKYTKVLSTINSSLSIESTIVT